MQGHPGGVAVRVQQQVEDERVFDHLDARIRPQRGDQGPLHLQAGRIPAGVHDPVAQVPTFAGQREPARGVVTVERGAEVGQFPDPGRTLGDQDPDRVDVAQPDPGHEGVGQVIIWRILRGECRGDPTLRPSGRALVQACLGDQ